MSTRKTKVIEPRIYRLSQVIEMYGISKPTIYRLMKDGKFPQSVNIGPRAKGWPRSALKEWERGLYRITLQKWSQYSKQPTQGDDS